MNINFSNVKSDKIKNAFTEVVTKYETLHDFEITLKQKRIKSSTMQAQPIFNWASIIKGVKSYKVKLGVFVRDSDTIRVADMPHNVLVGWFAHELGHLVDYGPNNLWQMLGFGIKYLSSSEFKKQAEFKADVIAIEHGFTEEIITAKKFILNNDLMDSEYKEKIMKYYMSIDEVLLCAEGKLIAKPASGI